VEAIVLKPDLQESLERDAIRESRTVSDLVNEAVARYLREREQAKLERETAAYEHMHHDLARDYLGQWVAVHDGALVDHDTDVSALSQRLRQRYGRTSILIRQVREEPSDDLRVRSPRLVR